MFARVIPLTFLFALTFAAGSLCIGCGPQGTAETTTTEPESKRPKHRKNPKDKDAISEKGKKWGGWRWKGNSKDCFFITNNKCFDNEDAACDAAKCDEAGCVFSGGAPKKVMCDPDYYEDEEEELEENNDDNDNE